jgi:dihydroorotase
MAFDLLLKNGNCFLPSGLTKKDIAVKNGKIIKIEDSLDDDSAKTIDLNGKLVLPGVIDSQVHFREPGLIHKEDLGTGGRAAVKGGVCTFFEMPNTHPATTTVDAVKEKLDLAAEKSPANFGFFIGASGKNLEELKKAHDLPGCCGIKIFLGSSTGDLLLYESEKLKEIFKNTTLTIACHSENEEMLKERISVRDEAKSVHAHREWRSVDVCLSSTKRLIELAKECNRKVHVLHVTTKEEMEFLALNKEHCTVEVTPQHLTLFAPDAYDKLGTYAQMNPPIREKNHRDALWEGVLNGVVDVIGSDHAPHTREEKDRPYPASPSGMPGVQTILPLMLNYVNEGKISLERVVELLCVNPAKLYQLSSKGSIELEKDADFSVVDMEGEFVIEDNDQETRSGWTPFHGMKIKGKPMMTIVGGNIAMENNTVLDALGKAIEREVSK